MVGNMDFFALFLPCSIAINEDKELNFGEMFV
jgi:hypothetical protein